MTAPAITIDSWQTTAKAAGLMIDRAIDRLPVLNDGELVGILTRADVAGAFSRSDEKIEREIREDVILRSFWIPTGEVDIEVRGGEVTVAGTVESESVAELLPEAIQCVPGVVSVRSELHAQPGNVRAGDGSASVAGFERPINPR
jgi:CBS domain-containing protein